MAFLPSFEDWTVYCGHGLVWGGGPWGKEGGKRGEEYVLPKVFVYIYICIKDVRGVFFSLRS